MTVLECMYLFVYLCDIFLNQVNVLSKKKNYFSVLLQVLRIYVYKYVQYIYVCMFECIYVYILYTFTKFRILIYNCKFIY